VWAVSTVWRKTGQGGLPAWQINTGKCQNGLHMVKCVSHGLAHVGPQSVAGVCISCDMLARPGDLPMLVSSLSPGLSHILIIQCKIEVVLNWFRSTCCENPSTLHCGRKHRLKIAHALVSHQWVLVVLQHCRNATAGAKACPLSFARLPQTTT